MATARQAKQNRMRAAARGTSRPLQRQTGLKAAAPDRSQAQTIRRRQTQQRRESNLRPVPDRPREKPKVKNYIDFTLLLLILLLLAFGFVMLYSASSYVSNLKFGDSFYYLKRQMIAAVLGFAGMFVMAQVPYKLWKPLSPYIYAGAVGLCLLVFAIGQGHKGSVRWIQIGPVNFQPSELAKIAVIIFVAAVISSGAKGLRNFKSVLTVLFWTLPIVVAVALANLSTAIIIAGIAVVMLFVAYPKVADFLVLGALGVLAVGAYVLIGGGYRAERIETWLHPTYKNAYQTLQGLYAIGSGGLFGKGLGESMQKGFVPEAHNDMIFSIICEELGLFGALCLILLFLVLIWRLVMIAIHCKDMFGTFLVIGILAHISLQFILNIAVVTNTIPNTGVTLPFISYGSTALLVTLTEMGIALSVSKNTFSALDGIEEDEL